MRRLAVLTLLAAVTLSQELMPTLLAQAEAKGQACASDALVGTWELTTPPRTPGITKALKHITPTHFFVVRLADSDVVQSGHGGPYSLVNGTYTETIAHGFGGRFDQFKGVSVSSTRCEIVGDVLHVAGEYKGETIDERWRKVSRSR